MNTQYQRTTTATRREERLDKQKWFHISCEAYMAPNPLGSAFPALPFVSRGVTYRREEGRTP